MRGRRLLAAMSMAVALAGAPAGAPAAGPPYGEVRGVADVDRIYDAIRADVEQAQTRTELTRLYRRAGYLVTLTYSRGWRARFGDQLAGLRAEAKRQFVRTVEQINRRASRLELEPSYDAHRGDS